jgi:glycosyltransferase 2 family protein
VALAAAQPRRCTRSRRLPALARVIHPRARKAARAIVCVAAAAAAAFYLRRMPFAEIGRALRDAQPLSLLLATLVYLGPNTAAKVLRWAALLAEVPRRGEGLGRFELARVLFASQAASNLLPARAGEAVRVVELRRRGYGTAGLIAAQLYEKVVEAASLCLLGGVAAAVARVAIFRVPAWMPVLAGAALVALLFVAPRYVRALRFRRDAAWARSLGWSCAADLADAAVLGLCLHAVGAHVAPAALLVVLLAINVAILIPSTPGHVGVMEAAALAALLAVGVSPERALAGAVLYHAVQIVPGTALGLVSLRAVRAGSLA